MSEQKWTYILLFLLLVFVSSLWKWMKQTKGQKASPSQSAVAVAKILIASLVLVALISLPLMEQPRIAGEIVLPAGVLLILFGLILNVFVARELRGIKFQMRGLGIPDRLLTTGLFSIIRHPSSLGIISMMIGWYLAWGGLYCIYFVAPIIVIGIFIGNKFEERNLERTFGDEYRIYKKSVGMYFPKIRRVE